MTLEGAERFPYGGDVDAIGNMTTTLRDFEPDAGWPSGRSSDRGVRVSWRSVAACKGTDPGVFVVDIPRSNVRRAKNICARCSVLADCLRYAVDNPELVGVFGGTTAKERRAMCEGRTVARLPASRHQGT